MVIHVYSDSKFLTRPNSNHLTNQTHFQVDVITLQKYQYVNESYDVAFSSSILKLIA